MMSGRHRTSNRVIDKCSHVPPSNILSVLATNGIRLQRWPWTEFPNPNQAGTRIYRGIFFFSMQMYHITWTRIIKKCGWKTMTLRYVPGTRGRGIHACYLGKAPLGRGEITPGVRIVRLDRVSNDGYKSCRGLRIYSQALLWNSASCRRRVRALRSLSALSPISLSLTLCPLMQQP